MRQGAVLIPLLLLASLAVDAVAVSMQEEVPTFGDPAWVVALALVFAQTNMVAIWFALGRSSISLRFVGVVLVPVAWACALGLDTVALLVQAAVVAVPLLVARALGCEVVNSAAAQNADGRLADLRRFQFTIAQMLGWTTAVAIVLGVMKWVTSIRPLAWNEALDPGFVVLIIGQAVIAVAALWVALGTGRPLVRLAVFGLIAAAVFAVDQKWSVFRKEYFASLVKFHLAEALVLLGSLGVVRVAGYRLRFARPTKDPPQAAEQVNTQ